MEKPTNTKMAYWVYYFSMHRSSEITDTEFKQEFKQLYYNEMPATTLKGFLETLTYRQLVEVIRETKLDDIIQVALETLTYKELTKATPKISDIVDTGIIKSLLREKKLEVLGI